jgi:hypothetical protein
VLRKSQRKTMNTYHYSMQELWNSIKRPKQRIHGAEGVETPTGVGYLFNEITTLCNYIDTYVIGGISNFKQTWPIKDNPTLYDN